MHILGLRLPHFCVTLYVSINFVKNPGVHAIFDILYLFGTLCLISLTYNWQERREEKTAVTVRCCFVPYNGCSCK